MTEQELVVLASDRLEDSRVLLASNRFHGALYLAGYSMECALKARVCRFLGWSDYRVTGEYKSMRSHDFVFLLSYTGRESVMQDSDNQADWTTVRDWRPELRYSINPSVGEHSLNGSNVRMYIDLVERLISVIA